MGRRHTEIFPKFLPCKLTDDQRMKYGVEIGEIQNKMEEAEKEFKEYRAAYNHEMKRHQERCKTLGEATRTGHEERTVDCQRRYDYSSNEVIEYRLDTMDEIGRRSMTISERQMFFNFAVVEPTVESTSQTSSEDKPEEPITDEQPKEVTAEDVQEAASFNDVEWQFKEEVASLKPRQLAKQLKELEAEADTPTVSMKRRVLRDEINRRGGVAPNEFGVYKDFAQTEVIVKEGDGWRVNIQTLHTPVGWLRGFSFYTQFEQTGGEVLTALHVHETQATAIMDAAYRLKVLNKRDNKQTGAQKKAAQQICDYCDQVIAEQAERIAENQKDDGESASAAAGD
jgi:hypothetical protein